MIMKKLLKNNKGSHGYLNKQRIIETIKTILMFAAAIGLYLIGYITLKTNKSIWSILAVLSVLPAAKSAVVMIMFYRFSSLSDSEYHEIDLARGNIPTCFELVFTTSEKSYFVKAASCCDSNIIMLYDNKAKKDQSTELKNHVTAAISREGFSGYTLKIYTKKEDYIKRLKEMDSHLDGEKDITSERVFLLFKAITI